VHDLHSTQLAVDPSVALAFVRFFVDSPLRLHHRCGQLGNVVEQCAENVLLSDRRYRLHDHRAAGDEPTHPAAHSATHTTPNSSCNQAAGDEATSDR